MKIEPFVATYYASFIKKRLYPFDVIIVKDFSCNYTLRSTTAGVSYIIFASYYYHITLRFKMIKLLPPKVNLSKLLSALHWQLVEIFYFDYVVHGRPSTIRKY